MVGPGERDGSTQTEGARGGWLAPVWMRARSDLRGRFRAAVVLAVLIGLAGTVVMTAEAGARRTDTAYPRYLAATHANDYLISTMNTGDDTFYRMVEKLPQVARAGIGAGAPLVSETDGKVDQDYGDYVQSLASEDGKAGYSVSGVKLSSGRLPDPDKVFEAVANVTLARKRHLHAGSRFTMYLVPPAEVESGFIPSTGNLKPLTFTITGIGTSADEVVPIAPNDGLPTLMLTPAFDRRYDRAAVNFDGVEVRLKRGSDRAAFVAAVNKLANGPEARDVGGIFIADLGVHTSRVQRAIHPEALALELFAGLVALAALLAIGQVIAREVFMTSGDHGALRAMGFDRPQLALVAVTRLLVPVVAGTALAVAGSVLASPLMPIGAARLAEPSPGIAFDATVASIVAVAMIFCLLAVAAGAGWRISGHDPSRGVAAEQSLRKPSRFVEFLSRSGVRPPMVAGVRMALEPGRGRSSVPVRSAIVGIIVAVAAVVSVLTFSSNLSRLISTPHLYGVNWSYGVDGQFNAISRSDIEETVSGIPGISSVAGGIYGDDITIDGRVVPIVGVDAIKGSLFPTIVAGRRPENPREIALGAVTMRELRKSIGDSVSLEARGRTYRLKVVGKVVLPSFGRGSFTPTDLGQGAAVTGDLVAQMPAGRDNYNFVLLGYAPGADAAAITAHLVAFAHHMGCAGDQCLLPTRRVLPTDIRSYNQVRDTPAILAAILAGLGVAMIGHVLVTSVRRRRRDLAVLKTLGFVKREVATAVAWQVSTFAVVGLAVGVPLGVIVGRWLWALFADQIGVPPSPAVPLLVLTAIPIVLAVANLIGAAPARAAARTRPAVFLRSE